MSTNKPSSGLGRGLQALLGEQAASTAAVGEQAPVRLGGVREIEIGRIRPNPEQPRIQFKEEAIDELADSIAERGVLQPILLRPHGDGFEIVAGERRWRAAQQPEFFLFPDHQHQRGGGGGAAPRFRPGTLLEQNRVRWDHLTRESCSCFNM